jgi:hypothetical protein
LKSAGANAILAHQRDKAEIPKPKLQVPSKSQIPMAKNRTHPIELLLRFGHWDLFGIWDLGFGASIAPDCAFGTRNH